jgi:hypothetical protein
MAGLGHQQLKILDPLVTPTAHGASASDAFHLVIPSMPGYEFSGKPTATGWDPARIARSWVTLMKRLGYRRNLYIASEAFHSILFATSSTHTIVQ